MTKERMAQLLDHCIRYIKYDNSEASAHLHDICGFTDEELAELGYDYLAENEKGGRDDA